ncbi:hypothetical protein [Salisediminibacterium halotolerans]|uniref:baeRF3 domain-containing protein n=1 Tax=Salisediminibacterium halotolerans TaxID=517425 RepID=UPI000EB46644|nr:hypothetical protein [Salisediminibacterium halotolerans]RLJ74392.1 hypothetical protein BCL39_1681 [Actinophytocola xinjiangensis]RPE87515.1 hypothetical protein EDD67_1250 [Salisediminibacterium halotolerans]TWG35229.1 hypothetical protein BCL52_1678 [Salisediminibacterium halotolerans]GEL08955.1 hypothetical protein SHA02_23710 [Salisediminibacterium halotolerans]
MYQIVTEFPHPILYEQDGPFLSLYQPTHRYSPDNQQDPIVFKKLLGELKSALSANYPNIDSEKLMKPLYDLQKDKHFWNNTLDGLAILLSPQQCAVYRLPRPVNERSYAGDRLHIHPLIRVFQSADQYQLLGINRDTFHIFQGNRYGLNKLEVNSGDPQTREEVLGDQRTERYLARAAPGSAGGTTQMFGHGSKKDEEDKDTEKFFRYVDQYVYETFSKPSQVPLIFTGLKQHHGVFKKISNNPFLLEDTITADPDSVDEEALRKKAWHVLEPMYLEKTKKLTDAYHQAKAKGKATDSVYEIGEAVIQNRVQTMLVDDQSYVPGKLDETTGEVTLISNPPPAHNDVHGELAEIVYKQRAEVVVLPSERMPTDKGIAAVLR